MTSVSAVVPCFNGRRWLAEALASVEAQTRRADEVIVVDDGSTDGSAELAEELGATVVRQRNLGEGAARNAGTRAASGDVVAWLDADDRWRPRHLEVLVGLLDHHPRAAVACGAVQCFGLRTEFVPGYVRPGPPGTYLREAFRDWLHTTIGAVVRRSALLEVGGFVEHERFAVDFDFWLRLARTHQLVATAETTAEWRRHDGQQSATPVVQLASAYRARNRLLDAVRDEGDDDLRAELEQVFRDVWREDVVAAARRGHGADLPAVARLGALVPGLPPSRRAAARLLSSLPAPVGRRLLRVRLG